MTTPPTHQPTRTASRRHVLGTIGSLCAAGSVALAGCLDGDLAGTATDEYRSCDSFNIEPGADLNEQDLSRCDLSDREIQAIRFRFADLSGANFEGSRLFMMDATAATLDGATFRGADLASADLYRASARNVDFREADLTRTDMRRTDLTGANLTGATLTWTQFGGATMPDGSAYKDGDEVVRTP